MNDYDIKQMYEEMETYLIDSMKRNLGRHLLEEEETGFQYTQWQAEKLKELKRYQRENKEIVGRYTLGLDEKVSKHLQNELKQGSINAIKQYNKAIPSDKLKPSEVMNKSFFRTNDKKVNALIKTVNNDLKVANASALRMTNDQYRQIIHKSAMFVSNGVLTEKQATAQAVKEIKEKKLTTLAVDEASKNFLAGGLNCIVYKDGRRVNIASYAQMAIRTASLRAQLMAEGNLRAQKGLSLVQVTSHGGSCKYCSGWENKVLVDDVYSGGKPDGKHKLLSEAMAQGFLHPNCRHGVTTYFPELEDDDYEDEEEPETSDTEAGNIEKDGISEEEKEELVKQLNYVIRNIKRFKRLERGSLTSSNVDNYRNKRKRLETIKKTIADSLYEIKTNEKIALKLYDFPEKDYLVIKEIIDNAPPSMRKIINDNIEKFKFKNIKTRKTARYFPLFDNIKLNLKKDRQNEYMTLFHEMSHKIDSLLGDVSQDGVFEKLLIDDFEKIKRNFMLKYKLNESETYEQIGKIIKSEKKANSISDIVGGITKNKCLGGAKHSVSYWEGKGKIAQEAFAHFGSASIRKDKKELFFIEQIFPNAYQHFKNSIVNVNRGEKK